MTAPPVAPEDVFRAFNEAGNPLSGAYRPRKADIVVLLRWTIDAIGALSIAAGFDPAIFNDLKIQVGDLAVKLAAEIVRAEAAESNLDGRLGAVGTRLGAEITRAEAADTALGGRLDTLDQQLAAEVARAEAIGARLAAEIARALASEGGLGGRLDTIDLQRATIFALASLRLMGPPIADGDDLPFIEAIVSGAARAVLGVSDHGGIVIPRLEQETPFPDPGDALPFLWQVQDLAGTVPLGLEPDGGLFIRLSAQGARDAGARLTPDPASFRGAHTPFNLRYGPQGTLIGTCQDADRCVYDVRQREDGPFDTAVVSDGRPLPIRIYYGQSQAGGGGADRATRTGPPYPRHVLVPNHAGKAFGGAVLDPYPIIDLIPLQDDPTGQQFIATCYGAALEALTRAEGPSGPGVIVPSVSYGGQGLAALARGQMAYNALIAFARQCPAVAARYGRRAVTDAILLMHGEAGPYGRDAYAAPLRALIENLQSDVRALNAAIGFDQAPQIFVNQENQFTATGAPGHTGVALAQLDVARARLGLGVTLTGPMYQTPVQADGIHMTNAGKALLAELHAHVTRRVLSEGLPDWNPLWPVTPTALPRAGATITCDLTLPPRTGRIAFDTDYVPAPPDGAMGFTYGDDSGAPPAIRAVAIGDGAAAGNARLTITLAAVPTGANRTLRYAVGRGTAIEDGWHPERGLVYADSGVPSPARAQYPQLPATIRHYLVAFEATVA